MCHMRSECRALEGTAARRGSRTGSVSFTTGSNGPCKNNCVRCVYLMGSTGTIRSFVHSFIRQSRPEGPLQAGTALGIWGGALAEETQSRPLQPAVQWD